jgi:hypothetical protein
MEPIEVTAHFDEQGVITPLHFTWQGGHFRVESTGRRWTDEAGQHMLVMLSSGQIYELVFTGTLAIWYIARLKPERPVI